MQHLDTSISTLSQDSLPTPAHPVSPRGLTFALARDSQSGLRLVSFVCDDDDLVKDFATPRESFALPYDYDGTSISEEEYWTYEQDIHPPPASPEHASQHHYAYGSPAPPQTATSSTFAFHQNHCALKGPPSSRLSASFVSGENDTSSQRRLSEGRRRLRGTVVSSTLGGVDVYMRTGSMINWTHHPQYAAATTPTIRFSRYSFLGPLRTWDGDGFEFDPITPFAKQWMIGEKRRRGELGSRLDLDWETVQAPLVESKQPPSPSTSKRLKKRRPSHATVPNTKKEPVHVCPSKEVSQYGDNCRKNAVACSTRQSIPRSAPASPLLQVLLPRPCLGGFMESDAIMGSLNCNEEVAHEAWVWIDVKPRALPSDSR